MKEKNIVMMEKVGRKRKRTSTDTNDVKKWSDLPNELLESIKKRLFFADQQNLRSVCKSWSCIEEKRLDVPPLQQMPWALVFDETDTCKLIDSKYKKIYMVDMKSIKKKLNIDSFDKMQCHESKYGWLLISSKDQSHGSTTLFLYSPFFDENNNCIELPILSSDICLASFTSNPLDDDDGCTVVTLNKNTPSQVDTIVVNTYRLGHSLWNSQEFKGDQYLLWKVKHWMYNEGMFYCVNVDGKVGAFDLAREHWNVIPSLPMRMQESLRTLIHWNSAVKIYMVKSGGELFVISEQCVSQPYCEWSYNSQYIYRLDLLSMIWEDLKSIGERVLFIGDGYNSVLNTSVLKSNGERKGISNTIYYCSHLDLKYCTVHDYTVRSAYYRGPRRRNCSRHYGKIVNGQHRKLLIDPPPLPPCPPQ